MSGTKLELWKRISTSPFRTWDAHRAEAERLRALATAADVPAADDDMMATAGKKRSRADAEPQADEDVEGPAKKGQKDGNVNEDEEAARGDPEAATNVRPTCIACGRHEHLGQKFGVVVCPNHFCNEKAMPRSRARAAVTRSALGSGIITAARFVQMDQYRAPESLNLPSELFAAFKVAVRTCPTRGGGPSECRCSRALLQAEFKDDLDRQVQKDSPEADGPTRDCLARKRIM